MTATEPPSYPVALISPALAGPPFSGEHDGNDASADGAKYVSPAPTMSVFSRAVAIFTRPAQAWEGLRERAQWWFPLLIMVGLAGGFAARLHHRAFIPMMSETWDDKVQSGELPAEQVDKMERFFSSPAGLAR